jgi:hypothetical protein
MDESLIRQYLLGELSPEEQEPIEKRVLSDDASFETFLLVEDELMDQYVRGGLNREETRLAEKHFLASPERQRSLRFAKAFQRYVGSTPAQTFPQQSPNPSELSWWQKFPLTLRLHNPIVATSLIAALLLLLAGNVWMLAKLRRSPSGDAAAVQAKNEELQKDLARQRDRNDELAKELSRAQNEKAQVEQQLAEVKGEQKPAPSPVAPGATGSNSPMLSFVLTSNRVRGSDGQSSTVPVPSNTRNIQLRLVLDSDEYKDISAVVHQVGGPDVHRVDRVNSRTGKHGPEVSITLPVADLEPGDYLVELIGRTSTGEVEGAGKFYFRLVKN